MIEDRGYYLTEDAWKRMSRVIRKVEAAGRGVQPDEAPNPAPHVELLVVATGMPVAIPTDGSVPPDPSTTDQAPSPAVRVVYPGRYVYRQFDDQTNEGWWVRYGDDCWIEDTNNQGLWVNCYFYPATPLGELNGVGVVGVGAAAEVQKLGVVSATPEITIAGVDYYMAVVLMWDAGNGRWTADTPFDDVLVADPANGGFMFGQEVWAKLTGPVLAPAYGGSAVGSGGSYGSPAVWTAFTLITTVAGGGPGNVRIVRTLLNSSQDPANPGANYVTDPDTGGIYYLSVVEGWSQGDMYFDLPGYVLMFPFYQPAMVGACSLPPVGYGWPCIDSGVDVTFYIDPVDGPPETEDGPPTSNPRFMTLRVWEQADPLPRIGCDDSGNPYIAIP